MQTTDDLVRQWYQTIQQRANGTQEKSGAVKEAILGIPPGAVSALLGKISGGLKQIPVVSSAAKRIWNSKLLYPARKWPLTTGAGLWAANEYGFPAIEAGLGKWDISRHGTQGLEPTQGVSVGAPGTTPAFSNELLLAGGLGTTALGSILVYHMLNKVREDNMKAKQKEGNQVA